MKPLFGMGWQGRRMSGLSQMVRASTSGQTDELTKAKAHNSRHELLPPPPRG